MTVKNNKSVVYLYCLLVIFVIFSILFFLFRYSYLNINIRKSYYEMYAKNEAETIALAVKAYESEFGTLPYQNSEQKTIEYKRLISTLINSKFIDKKCNSDTIIDPWGNFYKVVYDKAPNDKVQKQSVLVYSYGPNGVDDSGTNDDICSWKDFTPSSFLYIRVFGKVFIIPFF